MVGRTIEKRTLAIVALSGALFTMGSAAWGDPAEAEQFWAEWRGPNRTGASATANPPTRWSETSNIKWKAKLSGGGSATPIVWKDRIFLATAIPSGGSASAGEAGGRRRGMSVAPAGSYKFALLCLNRANGKTLWQKVVREEVPHEGHHPDHGFASHSPITDGTHVYAYFGSRGLHCFDLNGNKKWSKDFGKMRTRNEFGEGSSPALYGDTLIVTWDHEGDDFIVALDKRTGKEKWRKPRNEPTSWATPLIVSHGGKTQVIVSGTNRIRSYDLANGAQLWECGGMTTNTIPTPVYQNGTVYVTSGFRGNALLAIRLGRAGDLTGTDAVAWSHNRSTPYVPSPLLYEDRLYFFANNNAILSCFDAKTGKPILNAERIEGMSGVYASPVGAKGKVYLVGRNGTTVVLKRSDRLEVLATNRLEESFDASPVLVGKELFLRGKEHLYCIAEK